MKASLAGSEPYGMCYQDLKIFNPLDIHNNVGL